MYTRLLLLLQSISTIPQGQCIPDYYYYYNRYPRSHMFNVYQIIITITIDIPNPTGSMYTRLLLLLQSISPIPQGQCIPDYYYYYNRYPRSHRVNVYQIK